MILRACIPVLMVCAGAYAGLFAEELPPLSVVQNDTLILKNGERIPGKVDEVKADGTVIFTEIGRSRPLPFAKDQYASYEPSQDAMQAVLNRGRILLKRKDILGVKQCIIWGTNNAAAESSLTLALEAVVAFPGDTEIGTLALSLLSLQNRAAEREPIAKALLEKNPRFEPAYIVLTEMMQQRNQTDQLVDLTNKFLAVMPTSEAANRIKAELAETSDLRGAQEAYRKGWSIHQDLGAALGFARTSLLLGDYESAMKGADALLSGQKHESEARVIAGTSLLALGRLDDARAALLIAAVDGSLGEPYKTWAVYNLGVVEFRLGNAAGAREQWSQQSSPIAQLALAIAEHKPFTAEASLPASAALRSVVREHNACMALERGHADKALQGLDAKTNARHQFLSQIAEVVKTGGSEASLHVLAATDSVESLRWRAYGNILAKRWADAEAVLSKLPPDDGYAAVYRIYVAAAQKDMDKAKDLFRNLSMSANAPSEYVAVLAAEYASDNDEIFSEDFEWVDGDQLASGWQVEAIETNIRIHVAGGQLLLDGRQSASPQPITRTWRMSAADRTRQIRLTLDIAGIGSAQVGLELLDEERKNGVAYGILGDNKLGYRILRNSTWSDWQTLPLRVEGTKPTLMVEVTAGRVFAISPDQPSQRHALGDASVPTSGFIGVGAFGQAEPGTTWKLALDQLEIQMKATNRTRR